MRPYQTPGVYHERADADAGGVNALRTDIAGFVGIAERGPLHLAVRMRTQPIDARELATRLVELAEHPAHGRARDIAGPREEELADMMRGWAAHQGRSGWMPRIGLPGAFGRAMRSGALLPQGEVDLGRVTFAEWLSAQPER